MKSFSVEAFARHFPFLTYHKQHLYLDNAATSQKPQLMLDAINHYYQQVNSNVHRGSHQFSQQATCVFEQARQTVSQWLNTKQTTEIIWTKGTTEAINLVAYGLEQQLEAEDEIVISAAEHHANLVPWQMLAKRTQAKLVILPLTKTGQIDQTQAEQLISPRCKILAISLMSNVIGKYNPVKPLIKRAQQYQAYTLVDAAQAASHGGIDVQQLDCDFLVLSAHKVYGPTGLGVLYGKHDKLACLSPYQYGGEMIKHVSFEHTSFNDLPFVFEAGTPNIEAVIAFAQVITWFSQFDMTQLKKHEAQLASYGFAKLSSVPGLTWLCDEQPDIPLFSFNITGYHAHDVASFLDSHNIAVRAGHHCAMPLLQQLQLDGCVRASLAAYNSCNDIDHLVKVLQQLTQNKLSNTTIGVVPKAEYESVIQQFTQLPNWQAKQRQLMVLGKTLKPLATEYLTEKYLISGCESDAWLICYKQGNLLRFDGYSQAKIIRGLMVLIFALVNNKTAQQIIEFDEHSYFDQLGLLKQLSPSRGNGLLAIINAIKAQAKQAL